MSLALGEYTGLSVPTWTRASMLVTSGFNLADLLSKTQGFDDVPLGTAAGVVDWAQCGHQDMGTLGP